MGISQEEFEHAERYWDMIPSNNITLDNKNNDSVNHPSHYETGKFECIDVMIEIFGKEAVQTYCKINAFKYIYRTDRKNGKEDLQKASWYLNKYMELENGND